MPPLEGSTVHPSHSAEPKAPKAADFAPRPELLALESRRSELRAALRASFSGASFRFLPSTLGGRHLVARVAVGGDVVFAKARLNRSESVLAEAEVLRASKTLVPLVPVVELRGDWLLLRAVPGKVKKIWTNEDVRRVGAALGRLHGVKVPKQLRALPGGATYESTFREAHLSLELLSRLHVLSASDSKWASERLSEARAEVEDVMSSFEPPLAVCHGDLRAENVLFERSGEVHFIDFEHAGRGDPAIDLARTCAYLRLSRHQTFELIDGYAELAADEAVIDRALALRFGVSLFLALGAARTLVEARSGRILHQDVTLLEARVPSLEERFSTLLGRHVRLNLR